MRKAFELPDLGEGIAEGEVVAWHVDVGDHVEEDEVIAEVETDKALVDLPSPYDGEIVELRAEEGEIVPVYSELVVFEVDGEEDGAEEGTRPDTDEAPVEEPPTDFFARPSVRRLAREEGVDLTSIQPDGPQITREDVLAAADGESDTAETEKVPEPIQRSQPTDSAGRQRTLAVPATRQLAREASIDINDVPASEQRDGEAFVTAADVRAYAESPEPAGKELVQPSQTDRPSAGERVPYTGIRRTIGERMAQSKYTAPHVTHHDEAEVSSLVEMRKRLKPYAEERDINLTYLPFVVKATVAALKEVPAINAELDEEAEEIILHDSYNIGIAVASDAGLMVPVIKDADQKSLLEIAAEINDKAQRARERSIDLDELQGGTFTITNVGVIGGEYASPIINYPEAAILALGSLEQRPWVEDGEVVARHTLPISMTSDHRIVDGADAGGFTNALKRYLHEPELLLLE